MFNSYGVWLLSSQHHASLKVSLAREALLFKNWKSTKISAYPLILTVSGSSDDTLNRVTIETSGVKEYMKKWLLAEYCHPKPEGFDSSEQCCPHNFFRTGILHTSSLASLVVVHSHCSSCTLETALTFFLQPVCGLFCLVFFKHLLIWSTFYKINFHLYYFWV